MHPQRRFLKSEQKIVLFRRRFQWIVAQCLFRLQKYSLGRGRLGYDSLKRASKTHYEGFVRPSKMFVLGSIITPTLYVPEMRPSVAYIKLVATAGRPFFHVLAQSGVGISRKCCFPHGASSIREDVQNDCITKATNAAYTSHAIFL